MFSISSCSARRCPDAPGPEWESASRSRTASEVAKEFAPQLVLLDIGLPGMDGYEVLRRLRLQSGELQGAQPVVAALTGYGQPAERKRMDWAGFDHELIKPADPKVLYSLLDSLK